MAITNSSGQSTHHSSLITIGSAYYLEPSNLAYKQALQNTITELHQLSTGDQYTILKQKNSSYFTLLDLFSSSENCIEELISLLKIIKVLPEENRIDLLMHQDTSNLTALMSAIYINPSPKALYQILDVVSELPEEKRMDIFLQQIKNKNVVHFCMLHGPTDDNLSRQRAILAAISQLPCKMRMTLLSDKNLLTWLEEPESVTDSRQSVKKLLNEFIDNDLSSFSHSKRGQSEATNGYFLMQIMSSPSMRRVILGILISSLIIGMCILSLGIAALLGSGFALIAVNALATHSLLVSAATAKVCFNMGAVISASAACSLLFFRVAAGKNPTAKNPDWSSTKP